MVAMLSSAPGQVGAIVGEVFGAVGRHSAASAEPGGQRKRGIDHEQPLPAEVGEGGAAEQRAEHEPAHADHDHQGRRAHPQVLFIEQSEDERVGDRSHRGRGDTERGAQGDAFAGAVHRDNRETDEPEGGEADEQHPTASEPVGQ